MYNLYDYFLINQIINSSLLLERVKSNENYILHSNIKVWFEYGFEYLMFSQGMKGYSGKPGVDGPKGMPGFAGRPGLKVSKSNMLFSSQYKSMQKWRRRLSIPPPNLSLYCYK